LAVKTSLVAHDPVPTLIFDEIDSGVGGNMAHRVSEKLRSVSKNHQVICLTHLPQIACRGQAHLLVTKRARKGRTITTLTRLADRHDRLSELARMLGGGDEGSVGYRHAEELLRKHG